MIETMKKAQVGYLMAILLVVVFMSCDKNEATINQDLLEETSFAENVFAQLSSDVDDAIPFDAVSSGRGIFKGFGFGFGKCMTRTVESPEEGDFPKTITIEYDGECTSAFKDIAKSGKIIITLTGHPRDENSQRIVTFENFTVNGNEIRGTKTYTYKGNGQFECVLEDGKIITKSGDVILRESSKTRALIAGGETEEDRSDDVYEVTGIAIGKTSDGSEYKKEIIEPLSVQKDCFWITKGVIETTIGESTTSVNFGGGTCDNIAIRTDENGNEEEFQMEMRIRKMLRKRLKN